MRNKIPKPPDFEKMHKRVEARSKVREQREALKQGISVEEYLQKEKDERIADVAQTLGISAEEVLAQKLDEQPMYCIDLMVRAKRLTTEQGITVTPDDVRAEDDRLLKEGKVSIDIQWDCQDPANHYWKYLKGEPVDEEHANKCFECGQFWANQKYKELLSTIGPGCLTKEELHEIHENGKIEPARKQHTESCERCKMHFNKHFEMYLDKILPYPD